MPAIYCLNANNKIIELIFFDKWIVAIDEKAMINVKSKVVISRPMPTIEKGTRGGHGQHVHTFLYRRFTDKPKP